MNAARAILALLTALIVAGAAPAPTMRRLDGVTLTVGDGPIVVSIRTNASELRTAAEAFDHFSARIVPPGSTNAAWQACTAASDAFCRYSVAPNGLRTLRFERATSTGELQIRYAYADSVPSAPIRIAVESPPQAETLKAIARSFGATPGPSGGPNVDALSAEIAVIAPPSRPREGTELVRVTCANAALYGTTGGAPIVVGGRALAAQAGQLFTARRDVVRGKNGDLRSIELGASIYVDAKCVKATSMPRIVL